MIIIEGPDGAGKTTLIETILRADQRFSLRPRMSSSIDGPVPNLRQAVEDDLASSVGAGHLYDRHALISEPIYGPICRGRMKPGFEDSNWFVLNWGKLFRHRPLLIFCLPPLEAVKDNLYKESHGQMTGVIENIEPIYWAYWVLAMRMVSGREAKVDIYDYTGASWCNFDQIAEDVQGHRAQFNGGM